MMSLNQGIFAIILAVINLQRFVVPIMKCECCLLWNGIASEMRLVVLARPAGSGIILICLFCSFFAIVVVIVRLQ